MPPRSRLQIEIGDKEWLPDAQRQQRRYKQKSASLKARGPNVRSAMNSKPIKVANKLDREPSGSHVSENRIVMSAILERLAFARLPPTFRFTRTGPTRHIQNSRKPSSNPAEGPYRNETILSDAKSTPGSIVVRAKDRWRNRAGENRRGRRPLL